MATFRKGISKIVAIISLSIIGFEKMKHPIPQGITTAMQLYFSGESFRNVQKFLKLQGVKMSHVAVYKWIRKYVTLMQTYLEKIQPKVGDCMEN